jgi:hypothetical protein
MAFPKSNSPGKPGLPGNFIYPSKKGYANIQHQMLHSYHPEKLKTVHTVCMAPVPLVFQTDLSVFPDIIPHVLHLTATLGWRASRPCPFPLNSNKQNIGVGN